MSLSLLERVYYEILPLVFVIIQKAVGSPFGTHNTDQIQSLPRSVYASIAGIDGSFYMHHATCASIQELCIRIPGSPRVCCPLQLNLPPVFLDI